MTTTNAELIAEAVEDALFCWAGEGLPDAQFIASRVTAALESATTVTDEMVAVAYRAHSESRMGRELHDAEHHALSSPVEIKWIRAALTAALTEGERR